MRGELAALLLAGLIAGCGDDDAAVAVGAKKLPPLGEPSCVRGAVAVNTADAAAENLRQDKDVCVTGPIGDLILDGDLGSSSMEYLGSSGSGSIGHIEVDGASDLTIRARLRSIRIDNSQHIVIERSVIGGTDTERTLDNLIQLVDTADGTEGIVIRDNDIGWTCADDSGDTGYGIRAYGDNDDLLIFRNRIHDLGADGIQGTGGENVVIDRNEIGPVGNCPGSTEHSDNIQITGTSDLRITNNWLHHNGCFAGRCNSNAGATYIHGGSENVLFENNLLTDNRGRLEVCDLGSGGTSASNITIRRNTVYDSGQVGLAGVEWDCDSGTGNLIERNIMVDRRGGFDLAGRRRSASASPPESTGGLASMPANPRYVNLERAGGSALMAWCALRSQP